MSTSTLRSEVGLPCTLPRTENHDGNIRTRRLLVRVVLVAFVLRLLVSIFLLGDLTDPQRAHWHFGYETGRVARSLALGHGFADPLWTQTGPTAWLCPVYPILLAAIFRLFGIYSTGSAIAAVTLNALFEALTAVPLYLIGKRLFDARTAHYTAWVWAFFPYSIFLSATWVWDTCLSTLVVSSLVWFTIEMETPRRSTYWAAYGALWGFAALCNPSLLAALPLLAGWLFFRNLPVRVISLQRFALAGALFLAIVSPWLVRNYLVFHRPVLMKSNFWLEMAAGNLGSHQHWWNDNQHPARNIGELAQYKQLGELAYMEQKKSMVLNFIRRNPAEYALLCVRRFIYLWTGYWSFQPFYLANEPMDPLNIVMSSTCSLSALWGIWIAFRKKCTRIFPATAVLLSVPMVFYFTHPDMSYRHPVEPLMVLFGVFAIWPVIPAAWEKSTVRNGLNKFRAFVRARKLRV